MNFVALRSLQCKDHALNISPNVLTVNWQLTKRCNYDCSYCSSFTHDAVSPFVSLESAYNFVNSCQSWTGGNKKIKWIFTGGEPAIDPNFSNLLSFVYQKKYTEQINFTTNGSLPVRTYAELMQYCAGITFSLHFEQGNKVIKQTLNKLVQLKQLVPVDKLISVNVMFSPGGSEQVINATNFLNKHNIYYIVRRLYRTDSTLTTYEQTDSSRRKSFVLKSASEQNQLYQQWKEHINDPKLVYGYSEDEETLLAKFNNRAVWHNAGVWTKFDYQEINTDFLISNNYNQFNGWICYAGVDQLYVRWDGHIFRGLCLNNGSLGHINDFDFLNNNQPTICERTRCTCNSDIATRKCASSDYLNLIGPIAE